MGFTGNRIAAHDCLYETYTLNQLLNSPGSPSPLFLMDDVGESIEGIESKNRSSGTPNSKPRLMNSERFSAGLGGGGDSIFG